MARPRQAPQPGPSTSPNILHSSRNWISDRWNNLDPRARWSIIGATALAAAFGIGVGVGMTLDGESKGASKIDLRDCPAGYRSGSIVRRQAAVVHRLGELEVILANTIERSENGKLLSDARERVEDLADNDAIDAMCISRNEDRKERVLLSPEAERLAGQLDAMGIEGFGYAIK